MKIAVKQLGEDTDLLLEEDVHPKDLDIDIGVMRFTRDLHVRAQIWRAGHDLTVDVHLEGERAFTCSLCLEEFNNLFEKDFTLHYDIRGLETVSIDPDVRDELILDHPIRVLCRKDCRGLCPVCGANRNVERCDCPTDSGRK